MSASDLGAVMAIENGIYTHPWTRGNFADSLASGYQCWVMEQCGDVIGFDEGGTSSFLPTFLDAT